MYEEYHLSFISKTVKHKGTFIYMKVLSCFTTLLGTIFTLLKV